MATTTLARTGWRIPEKQSDEIDRLWHENQIGGLKETKEAFASRLLSVGMRAENKKKRRRS